MARKIENKESVSNQDNTGITPDQIQQLQQLLQQLQPLVQTPQQSYNMSRVCIVGGLLPVGYPVSHNS
jgi:hypothetical protein